MGSSDGKDSPKMRGPIPGLTFPVCDPDASKEERTDAALDALRPYVKWFGTPTQDDVDPEMFGARTVAQYVRFVLSEHGVL